MFRPSFALSLVTALFAVDASAHSQSKSSHTIQSRSQSVGSVEPNENQRIVMDARRELGNQLRSL
ncbi:hypothetical protein [Neorhodopirellula lusitana]|uniref:hypothetical protein n=1 Tax=Neorhodopirellula lusitana TaxID=445327 RepID=UPI003850150C